MAQTHIYYFAYGSNMSLKRIKHRLPQARLCCTATLPEYDLRFHKVASDQSAKCDAYFTGETHCVFGVLYQLNQDEKHLLDQIEGVGKGYKVKTVQVINVNQERVSAFLYVATEIDQSIKPYDWYHKHVLTGAIEHDLPLEYINSKIMTVETKEDHDKLRTKRELSIYLS